MTLKELRQKITRVLENIEDGTPFTDEVFTNTESEIDDIIEQFEEELLEKLDELKEDL